MFLVLPDPHPDPLVRGTHPKIRTRIKISRIRNTANTILAAWARIQLIMKIRDPQAQFLPSRIPDPHQKI
jgi:hypothetical protein